MSWLLLFVVAIAQSSPSPAGRWVGPLELRVQAPERIRGAIPTVAEFTQEGDGSVTGTWRSLPPNTMSGTISGTLAKLRIIFYTDSASEPERCQATMEATGRITAANIYRIEAKKMTPDARLRKNCGPWPTALVWLLQRAN